jgi:AcrR family transcriptional regulator
MPNQPSTSARKAREFAAREELILSEARKFLLEQGFQGWNMDDLAKAVEYSKGTLYQHFVSKEDLLLGVHNQALSMRADLFEKATAFKGSTRERARAIGVACCEFAITSPDFFQADLMLRDPSFDAKASAQRQEDHAYHGMRCWRAIHSLVIEAMALGDMPRTPFTAEAAAFALVSVTVGSHIMSQEPPLKIFAGIRDAMQVVRLNQDLVCDGLGWKPLLRDHDYGPTDQRIIEEVFPSASAWLKAA